MNNISKLVQGMLFLILGGLAVQVLAAEKILAADFINKAAARGIADIGVAKLALERSRSQEVKAYAQRMIDDNTDINSKLTDLAREKKIEMANANQLTKKAQASMVAPNEKEFDIAYARSQVRSHQEKIEFFQRAANSDDSEIRAIANSTLPKLRQHLLMAEQLIAATAETKTDIYQDRENKVNTEENPGVDRVPTTDRDL